MAVMAEERGGRVFATDERSVLPLCYLLLQEYSLIANQILHRQRYHDCPGRSSELPDGLSNSNS